MSERRDSNRFGSELERLRKQLEIESGKKVTQKRVALSLGVTTQAYQNWIHGRRGKDIDLETIERLAKILKGNFLELVKIARPDIYHYFEKYGATINED